MGFNVEMVRRGLLVAILAAAVAGAMYVPQLKDAAGQYLAKNLVKSVVAGLQTRS